MQFHWKTGKWRKFIIPILVPTILCINVAAMADIYYNEPDLTLEYFSLTMSLIILLVIGLVYYLPGAFRKIDTKNKGKLMICTGLLFIIFSSLSSQSKFKFSVADFSKHWIQSEKESSGDTLVFRPEGHELLADAPMYLLYGGWTFFPEGQVYKHRWRKCGNDGEPPYRSGSWKKKGNVLKIKVAKEQFLYEIAGLDKEKLKVVVINSGKN